MNSKAPIPKYFQIQELLRAKAASMEENESFPSENDICETYNVSRITVQKAIATLVQEGLLYRIQGKGTFVSKPKPVQKAAERFVHQIAGFYGEMTSRGFTVQTKVLEQSISHPPKEVAQQLALSIGENVIKIRRLRLVNQIPNHIVTTYLPYKLFPGVERYDLSQGSLYTLLRETYGAKLKRAQLAVESAAAMKSESKLLNIKPKSPLLVIYSTVFDPSDQPIIYGFSRLREDQGRVEFEVVSQNLADQ